MNTKEAVQSLPEYVNVPLAELVESSTNPRKTFDDDRLEELAESIRSKGVLSPLLARRVNGHFEIVSGARRYRAAQRAGLHEVPVRIVAPNDAEALETQIIENIQRADVHPSEGAQGLWSGRSTEWYIIRSYLAGLLPAVTVLAFIDDLNIMAVRIEHPGRIIARIIFETSLR